MNSGLCHVWVKSWMLYLLQNLMTTLDPPTSHYFLFSESLYYFVGMLSSGSSCSYHLHKTTLVCRVHDSNIKLKMAKTKYTLEEPSDVAERIKKGIDYLSKHDLLCMLEIQSKFKDLLIN